MKGFLGIWLSVLCVGFGLLVVYFDQAFVYVGCELAKLLPELRDGYQGRFEILDYASEELWTSLPHREDMADIVPPMSGWEDMQHTAQVDAFFVHPTSYFGFDWNSPLRQDTSETSLNPLEWLSDWLARLSALVHSTPYNGVAKIFAPRYRQQTGLSYLSYSQQDRERARAVAYGDILNAFRHYLKAFNNERPFFLIGHSQGSMHLARLIREEIVPNPNLSRHLVAAYLLGAALTEKDVDGCAVCDRPDQINCWVGYNLFIRGGDPSRFLLLPPNVTSTDRLVCVNPLTWTRSDQLAPRELNLGSRPLPPYEPFLTGKYMTELLPGRFSAQCSGGVLWSDEPDAGFGRYQTFGFAHAVFPGRNYHGAETSFFFSNHRQNAALRAAALLSSKESGSTV